MITGAGAGAAVIVIDKVALPVPPALVAEIVAFVVPAVVGVPEIRPVLALTESPAGRPLALKLVGLFVAVIWYVKAEPTCPVAEVLLVMIGAGGVAATIVIESVALPVPPAFVAEIVVFVVPADVGVPEIKPVVVLTDNPAGRPVALKLVGLLVAVIW